MPGEISSGESDIIEFTIPEKYEDWEFVSFVDSRNASTMDREVIPCGDTPRPTER